MGINDSGRKKLTIVKVFEPRQVQGQKGPFEVLEFTATGEGTTESGKYSVSSKAMIEQIKVAAMIDCDVVVKASDKLDPDGNPYQNRKVTQIYIDGEPVKQPFSKVGYQRFDNTPSIEAQTAIKEIGECWRAGKLNDKEHLVALYFGWLRDKLGDVQPPPNPVGAVPIPDTAGKPPEIVKPQNTPSPKVQPPPPSRPTSKTMVRVLPAALKDNIEQLAKTVKGYERDPLIIYLDSLSNQPGSKSITEAYFKLSENEQGQFIGQVEDELANFGK